MGLFKYQEEALERVHGKRRCAFYHDMGLGKTFTGAAKLIDMGCAVNLVVCQKSKIGDWLDHLRNVERAKAYDLTTGEVAMFRELAVFNSPFRIFGVVNYDLLFRRDWSYLNDYGLMFDESSLLQNKSSKRTRAAMRLAEKAHSLVLLSGTPTDGKYERLWSQLRMLGWQIDEKLFWRQYVETETTMVEGFPITKVVGYKNEERLVRKMRQCGCDFLKTEDVLDLPEQTFVRVAVPASKEYREFARKHVVEAFGREFVGDTVFGDMTAKRMLAGAYSEAKAGAFGDILDSTSRRLVVFYNFDCELEAIEAELDRRGRPWSLLSGKSHELESFRQCGDGVAIVQYQAGAMGVNLQEANICVYFSPPLASSLFEQSKKRIHRVGQDEPCTYYELVSVGTVEDSVYATLAKRQDYTERLFELGR